jgi:hypothetical protein
MPTHAVGTFELTGWDEKTHEEYDGGAKLTRAAIGQRFHGDLAGDGSWESLMYYRADGTASYVGFERFVGSLNGHSGSFVVRTTGTFDGREAHSNWSIVPGSGTGELRCLRGDGTSIAPHGPKGTYTLEYDLDG